MAVTEQTIVPIVGIGASAGGIDALQKFFGAVSAGDGIAYIVVMHLSSHHESNISHILGTSTAIDVRFAEDGVAVEPDTVYVLPPGANITINDDTIQLTEKKDETHTLTIDHFFASLAAARKDRAVAVVLSGAGNDGSNGVKKIKAAEGIVLVQDPESAAYDSMPASAIATGVVDFSGMPDELPGIITRHLGRHSHTGADLSLSDIVAVLRQQTGHDFSGHKETTLRRRLQRRMDIQGVHNSTDYLRLLRENKEETRFLFREFLIGVTHFFRDPEMFTELKERVVPELIDGLSGDEPLRVWVPGCSSGEEAYSLAMIIMEAIDEKDRTVEIQIFGTDLDEQAIETARIGTYPAAIADDVSPERLTRFFLKLGDRYRIRREIRDLIVFSIHDINADPPFSRLQMLSCRNLLIYLKSDTQKRLIPLFHYSLTAGGVLILGSSESIGANTTLFGSIDSKNKLFRRKEVSPSVRGTIAFPTGVDRPKTDKEATTDTVGRAHPPDSPAFLTQQMLLDRYTPTAVLVDPDGTIIHVQGRTGKYLEAATGPPTTNIVDLARSGLRLELASALRTARSKDERVVRSDIWVQTNGEKELVELEVVPLHAPSKLSGRVLIVFNAARSGGESAQDSPVRQDDCAGKYEQRIVELEEELQKTRENHQATVEELESSNEELTSTNEELQAANEELQSANEEQESSKEELQSVNEELSNTNAELEQKIEELEAANDDIRNLLDSTEIATVFVDNNLAVRRFTDETKKVINLISSDVGRPLGHIAHNLSYDGLIEDTQGVIDTLSTVEKEVQRADGHWYQLRIIPYRTRDNRIAGAIITFSDIHDQKTVQAKIEEARASAQSAWQTVRSVFDMNPQGLAVLDEDGSIVIANTAFCTATGRSRETIEEVSFYGLLNETDRNVIIDTVKHSIEEKDGFRTAPLSFSEERGNVYVATGQVIPDHTPSRHRILLRLEAQDDE